MSDTQVLQNKWSLMESITSNTTVSVSLVIVIIGGVLWLTNIDSVAKRALEISQENKIQIEQSQAQTLDLVERTARIETKLDYLIDNIAE